MALLVQKLRPFFWIGGFSLLVEVHWKGSATNVATPSNLKTFLLFDFLSRIWYIEFGAVSRRKECFPRDSCFLWNSQTWDTRWWPDRARLALAVPSYRQATPSMSGKWILRLGCLVTTTRESRGGGQSRYNRNLGLFKSIKENPVHPQILCHPTCGSLVHFEFWYFAVVCGTFWGGCQRNTFRKWENKNKGFVIRGPPRLVFKDLLVHTGLFGIYQKVFTEY